MSASNFNLNFYKIRPGQLCVRNNAPKCNCTVVPKPSYRPSRAADEHAWYILPRGIGWMEQNNFPAGSLYIEHHHRQFKLTQKGLLQLYDTVYD